MAHDPETFAPGWPGLPPRWTSSAKTGVGTSVSRYSRVWFTLGDGILNEIYYPRIDQACTRDFGLIVTDGHGFFSEEKRHANSVHVPVADGVPAAVMNRDTLSRVFDWPVAVTSSTASIAFGVPSPNNRACGTPAASYPSRT